MNRQDLIKRLGEPRVILPAGAALALLAAFAVAMGIKGGDHGSKTPPPASRGGLIVESAPSDEGLDPARPLRCFVAGQFVGLETLAACAQRNGVATTALDVGVDATGALAAASEGGVVQPMTAAQADNLPSVSTPANPPPAASLPAAPPPQSIRASAPCWRFAGSEWRRLPTDMTLNACVQALFAGRCERPGGASYGRWGDQTLRLVPGRVESSGDNRSFRSLVEQTSICGIPQFGG